MIWQSAHTQRAAVRDTSQDLSATQDFGGHHLHRRGTGGSGIADVFLCHSRDGQWDVRGSKGLVWIGRRRGHVKTSLVVGGRAAVQARHLLTLPFPGPTHRGSEAEGLANDVVPSLACSIPNNSKPTVKRQGLHFYLLFRLTSFADLRTCDSTPQKLSTSTLQPQPDGPITWTSAYYRTESPAQL